ncbi:nuclear factor 7, brain-like isoform X1 [Pelodiscus sinensis]|uniref:nuclear factor 7, brain-like isoform X1 n=1 Tax=Pelodiscus sinensis TaxID=13735 RepID=UPI003F6D6B35
MASVREVSGFTEDLLCPICLSLFREPRVLECGHSFCATCLEPCVPVGQQHGLCPECRCCFALSSVATNWALRSLAEKARLLKLDDGDPAGGGGRWYFCAEHEEPLKLFCSQDKGPVCVICRDLPQHRGHDFLPIKNAVQQYQDKLTASLAPLTEHLNSAREVQRRQQENLAELESCAQDLLGYISKEFEALHQILREQEEGMKEAVTSLEEENREEMEERLKELDEEVASRCETLSRVQAEIDPADPVAFLRGIKELMRRVRKDQQGHSAEEDDGSEEDEESDSDAASSEEEEEGVEDENFVAVDPALEKFEDLVHFEAWQEMLQSIHADTDHNWV